MASNPRDTQTKAAVPEVASIIEDRSDSPPASAIPQASLSSSISSAAKTRKDLFGDCALVEIIHLHDCLRGALKALENDVNSLTQSLLLNKGVTSSRSFHELSELERRVVGRFKVIWSVFKAHSSAEDEFIWPTLQSKTQGRIKGSPSYRPGQESSYHHSPAEHHTAHNTSSAASNTKGPEDPTLTSSKVLQQTQNTTMTLPISIEQEEYEEDHADEERMFSTMDGLLKKLRSRLVQPSGSSSDSLDELMQTIHDLTKKLSQHLMAHLEKEEKQCMPLVVKHLTKAEIHELVGKIMGKRSSDLIAQIMTMAVQNLEEADREEMVKYMQQAMAGTFFDRWLAMSGWMKDDEQSTLKPALPTSSPNEASAKAETASAGTSSDSPTANDENDHSQPTKRRKTTEDFDGFGDPGVISSSSAAGNVTSQAELEKLIRAIATNPNLTSLQKNTTIQGLRDSVWKSNQRLRRISYPGSESNNVANISAAGSRTFAGHQQVSR